MTHNPKIIPESEVTNGLADNEPEIEGPGRQSFAISPELCLSESMVEEPAGREGSRKPTYCGVAALLSGSDDTLIGRTSETVGGYPTFPTTGEGIKGNRMDNPVTEDFTQVDVKIVPNAGLVGPF
ncbi:hypothetical protein ACROYT_G014352 [Oculina patagonica]